MSIQIRAVAPEDVARIHGAWAHEQSWNPGTVDAHLFPLNDVHGFLVASVDGRDVACVSIVKYGSTAFLGFYIVRDPADRGKGYGLQLFRHAQQYAKECNIGLDGVEPQQANYSRSGFTKVYDNARYEVITSASSPNTPPTGYTLVENPRSRCTDSGFIRDLREFDLRYSGLPRSEDFLAAWLAEPSIHSAFIHESTASGPIVGFGTVRPSATGYRIGPVFTASPLNAICIVNSLLAKVPEGSKVFVDVCLGNPQAKQVFESIGFAAIPGWATGRMWTKGLPIKEENLNGLFATMTLEIG
ncbi:hypothetical protein HDU82_009321 [Entophlyctis luteolus]|nr:hypothetical protein HDU82_009321 [Entophlyctis luteolus]